MGNDGGSIPKRRELVKEAVRAQTNSEAKESQQEQHGYRWTTCALSHKPLQAPVVSDYSGQLYNKDALLEYLLPTDDPAAQAAKSDAAKVIGGRVAGLKDVVEVKFQNDEGDNAGFRGQNGGVTWVCPITNKQLGPGVKAAYIVPCGHAFSEIALKEVAELVCLQCNEAYQIQDIITILPQKEEDKQRLQTRYEDLQSRGLAHSLKKASGKKKRKAVEANGLSESSKTAINSSKTAVKIATSGINNAATASLTAKVLAEEDDRAKRRKADSARSATVQSLFTKDDGQVRKLKDGNFMTRGFTIPEAARR